MIKQVRNEEKRGKMYKTHFFLKFVGRVDVSGRYKEIVSKVNLLKIIKKPKIFEAHEYSIGGTSNPIFMKCDIIDDSHCFSNVKGRNDVDLSGKVFPSKICYASNGEYTNNTYPIDLDIINNFELVAFFLKEELFNSTEISRSFVHVIIFHDEK